MAQFSRPDNDDTIDVWSDEGGGTTDIFQSIDEVTANDSDFVRSDTTPDAGEEYFAGMSTVIDPGVSTGHILRWRYHKDVAAGRTIQMRLILRDGSTTIVVRLFTNVSDIVAQDTYTLSTSEADSITDYSNLNVRIDAIRTGGGGPRRGQVTWVELEVPDAGPDEKEFMTVLRNSKELIDRQRIVRHPVIIPLEQRSAIFTASTVAVEVDEIHTTDTLVKVIDNDETHTTDMLVFEEFELTHTTDILVLQEVDLNHTTDVLVKVIDNDITHTTDTLVQVIDNDVIHTIDILVFQLVDVIHTTDLLVKVIDIDKIYTTDVLIQIINDISHTTDILVQAIFDKTYTTDILVQVINDINHTTDILIYETLDKVHTTDTLVQVIDNTFIHSTDVFILDPTVSNNVVHTTDILIKAISASEIDVFIPDSSTDVLLNDNRETDVVIPS